MKVLIVFYSFEGNTKHVAQKLSEILHADMLELVPKTPYPKGKVSKYLYGGKSAVLSETPKLEKYNVDIDQYDVVVLGTPVWAGRCAPPMRSFLTQESLLGMKVAVFACSMGRSAGKTFDIISELTGNRLIASEHFISPKNDDIGSSEEKINEFAKKISDLMK